MWRSRSFNVADILAFVGLGLVGVGSGLVALLAPEAACLVPLAGAVLGMGMVWFKGSDQLQASLTAIAAAVLLLIGFSVMGMGVFSLTGGESSAFSPLENLAWASTLCLAPGALLALTGTAVFWMQQRWLAKTAVATPDVAAHIQRQPAELAPTTNQNILDYRARLAQAQGYRQQILALVAQQGGAFGLAVPQLTADLEQWAQRVRQLVLRLSAYEENAVVRRDETAVPAAIARLEVQLAAESDPELRAEIEQTLGVYRRQAAQLAALQRLMRRTQLDLEETVAAMGTLYSQLQVLGALEIDSGRARRLAHDVAEQVHRLDDLLAAVEEVYARTAAG
ncbi:MAG: hypothetical protein KC425_02280 [Anaerolineales bacterium]|nr:hypothetical protein [Anaerolineales bacterium]